MSLLVLKALMTQVKNTFDSIKTGSNDLSMVLRPLVGDGGNARWPLEVWSA